MIVKSLTVRNFRNYKEETVEFIDGLNVLMGKNAQGKTNLLEAVYLSSVGKSPRTPRDKELILWNEKRAFVKVIAKGVAGENSVEIIVDKSENKRIALNLLPISRMGELMGVVPTVFFAPSEIKIVQSSPSERRTFLDIALCQMSRAYFYLLIRYNKILSQRNKLLKSGKADEDSLDVWDMQLADSGAKIIKSRKGYIKRLEPFAVNAHSFLTSESESLTLSYEGADGESIEEIQKTLLSLLKKTRSKDLELGYTHIGPQKDDLIIRSNDIDLRTYGSQGQIRTTALSLKLGELELFKSETGESPVLLLDDVLSELDKFRQERLLQRISSVQTILTCTYADSELFCKLKDINIINVENGRLIKQT